MDAIVRSEVAERLTAARAYGEAGRSRRAEDLRAEADLLSTFLRDPSPSEHPSPGDPPSARPAPGDPT
jgi:hypothetical protein